MILLMIKFLHCNILQFITASSYMIVKHFIVFMFSEVNRGHREISGSERWSDDKNVQGIE